MIGRLLKFGKGRMLQKKLYYEAIINQGTDEEPNEVVILINADCKPEQFLGKKISIEIKSNNFKFFKEEKKGNFFSDLIQEA